MIFLAAFFILGTIVGSFLNVVALRYNTGRGVVVGRSACFSCGHVLEWYELIPLFSFLFLGGRCHKCKSRISWQYPMIEFLTGVIFLGTFLKYFPLDFSFLIPNYLFLIPDLLFLLPDLVVFSILIVILIYDIKHKIIPDGLVYGFIILSLLKLLLSVFLIPNPLFSTMDLLSGPVMFLPFFFLWYFSGGRWMGFGDAKLALGIGWFLGFAGAVSAIVLGFWIGAATGILLLLIQGSANLRLKEGRKKLTMKSEIPFAPFLIIGLLLVYFFGFDVVGLHYLFIR